jgi:hypothetical protein
MPPVPVIGGALVAYILLGRRRQLSWGATARESDGPLPGDDFMAAASLVTTRAITVGASVDEVGPWIAQLGQGRGGFYSYDFMENLVGCNIHSADHVVPEWQNLAVADQVKLHPEVGLEVAALEPRRSLVLHGAVPMGNVAPPYDCTWTFILHDQPDGTTRLLARERYAYKRSWAPFIIEPVAVISFVMSQKMLRGIRDRAERASTSVGPTG